MMFVVLSDERMLDHADIMKPTPEMMKDVMKNQNLLEVRPS